jgi:RNA polymerase sigma-70 factor (ECF subfamily)
MNSTHSHQLLTLDRLFRRYYKALRTYAFRYVNDTHVAEDIVQDVFLELWNGRDRIRFDDPVSVKSYLFKSVFNRSINSLNARITNLQSSLDGLDEEQIIENQIHSHFPDQEQSLLLKELEEEIAAFIESLPARRKEIFTLSRTCELKNREIAGQLGISIKAVEKQITQTLADLKKHLLKKDLLFLTFMFQQFL